jgi:hypothetical protein
MWTVFTECGCGEQMQDIEVVAFLLRVTEMLCLAFQVIEFVETFSRVGQSLLAPRSFSLLRVVPRQLLTVSARV